MQRNENIEWAIRQGFQESKSAPTVLRVRNRLLLEGQQWSMETIRTYLDARLAGEVEGIVSGPSSFPVFVGDGQWVRADQVEWDAYHGDWGRAHINGAWYEIAYSYDGNICMPNEGERNRLNGKP